MHTGRSNSGFTYELRSFKPTTTAQEKDAMIISFLGYFCENVSSVLNSTQKPPNHMLGITRKGVEMKREDPYRAI